MSKIVHKLGELSSDAALAEALTSPDIATRIMARGAAPKWLTEFTDWFNVELRQAKRSGNVHLLIYAIARLQVQTFATLAAQLSGPDSDETLIEIYLEVAKTELREHMTRSRRWGDRR